MKRCKDCLHSREHRVQVSAFHERVQWVCQKHTVVDPVHGRVPGDCRKRNASCDCPDWEELSIQDGFWGMLIFLGILVGAACVYLMSTV